MKALFITKPFVIEPLGIMYVSAAGKSAGHETRLVLTNQNLERAVEDYGPDIVGYSVMTGDQKFYLKLNRQLKEKNRFVSLFGGPHPTFFPNIIEEEGVDVVCRGEGEAPFIDLMNNLR